MRTYIQAAEALDRRDYQGELKAGIELLRIDNTSPYGYMHAGIGLEYQNLFDEAIMYYQKGLRFNPGNAKLENMVMSAKYDKQRGAKH